MTEELMEILNAAYPGCKIRESFGEVIWHHGFFTTDMIVTVSIGKEMVWQHTFSDRYRDPDLLEYSRGVRNDEPGFTEWNLVKADNLDKFNDLRWMYI